MHTRGALPRLTCISITSDPLNKTPAGTLCINALVVDGKQLLVLVQIHNKGACLAERQYDVLHHVIRNIGLRFI